MTGGELFGAEQMADQTVTVNLQLLYDPRSGRAFQQMAQEAAKASAAANKATSGAFSTRQQALNQIGGNLANLGAYGTANTVGRVGSVAQGLQGFGMSGAASFAQKAALPLAIAGQILGGVEKVAGYAHDKYSTGEQIGRQAFRDFVPFGERIQKFTDNISGRTAGYEQASIDAQRRAAEVQGALEKSSFAIGFNPQQAGREALAKAYKGQTAVTGSVFDRSTAEGERAYRLEQRVLPLKQAEAKAERDAAVATAEQLAAQKELNRVKEVGSRLTVGRQRLERQLKEDGFGSGVNRQEVLKRLETTDVGITGNIAQQREAANAAQAAQERAVAARTERDKARMRTDLIGQAETLEFRAERAEGAAARIGGMNPFERAFGFQAARIGRRQGKLDGLPQEYLQAWAQFDPEGFAKAREATGKNSAEFQAFEKEFPGTFEGDPEGLRRRAAELRKQAGEVEFKLDSSAADSLATSGKKFGDFIVSTFERMIEASKQQILRRVYEGRNAN